MGVPSFLPCRQLADWARRIQALFGGEDKSESEGQPTDCFAGSFWREQALLEQLPSVALVFQTALYSALASSSALHSHGPLCGGQMFSAKVSRLAILQDLVAVVRIQRLPHVCPLY